MKLLTVLLIAAFNLLVAVQAKAANPLTVIVTVDSTPLHAPVKVISWGSRAIYLLGDSYFNETKDDIIAQIGQTKFDDMKNKCSSAGWPSAMYNDNDADSIVDAKMNQLKMYQIAAYQHKYNGNVFDRYVILEVPYAENAEWDPTVTWEGSIYFIIKEADVVSKK